VGAILRETSTGREWHLDEGEIFSVGRGAECDVTLSDPLCGRRHAKIDWRDGAWFVTDHSSNGTLLNGAVVVREEMRSGDVLTLGATQLAFRDDGVPPRAKQQQAWEESMRLPQSFAGLLAVFSSPATAVDAALIAARAGEALLRFCDDPARHDALKDAYRRGLSSPWPVMRAVSAHGIAALSAAGSMGADHAGAAIEELLSDPADYVQHSAARALAKVDPLAAAPRLHERALAALERGREPREARETAAALAELGPSELLDSLRTRAMALAFDARDNGRRAIAAASLGELCAAGDAAAIRPLRALLAEPGEELRVQAARALAHASSASEEAREALRGALSDPSPRVFLTACKGLADRRDPALTAALISTLRATPKRDVERRARLRRALEDVTGERRGPDPDAWLA